MAAGRDREADAEERRANELWETKGATLLADRAQSDTAPAELPSDEHADEHGTEPVDERSVGPPEHRRGRRPTRTSASNAGDGLHGASNAAIERAPSDQAEGIAIKDDL